MNRSLLSLIVTSTLFAACSATSSDHADVSAAADSTAPPVAVPVDGSYQGSCSDKYGSVDLTVVITNGAVSAITGDLEGRGDKFRVGNPVTSWSAPLTATAASIDASLTSATIHATSSSSIAYSNVTQVMQSDETTITTTGTCATTLSFASIEIMPHNGDGNVFRSVTVHGVTANGATCDIANGPVDDTGDWYIECGEDEGAVSSAGLDVLTAVLRGAQP